MLVIIATNDNKTTEKSYMVAVINLGRSYTYVGNDQLHARANFHVKLNNIHIFFHIT